MPKRFKRKKVKKVKKVRTSYTYKPSSLNQTEKKVYLSMIGSFLIILVIAIALYIWGTDIVFSIDSFWRRMGGTQVNKTQVETNDALLAPPSVDPLPLYTNKQKIDISGWAQSGLEVAIYLNDAEIARVLADANGRFEYTGVVLNGGENKIYAKTVHSEKFSDSSDEVIVELDTEEPTVEYNLGEINKETGEVVITGTTEGADKLFINGRRVILKQDGAFEYTLKLKEGENKVKMVAEDLAGNKKELEEIVTYESSNGGNDSNNETGSDIEQPAQ